VVLDESVLKRRVGDDQVMYEQLQRLEREADRPNLTLQILPLDADTVFGESFVIFGFGADAEATLHDVVSTEHLKNDFSVEGERETHLHRIAFQMLASASLDPASSKALILETAQAHWSGSRRSRLSLPRVGADSLSDCGRQQRRSRPSPARRMPAASPAS